MWYMVAVDRYNPNKFVIARSIPFRTLDRALNYMVANAHWQIDFIPVHEDDLHKYGITFDPALEL